MKKLLIKQCQDSLMWYADKIGQMVPFEGRWPDGYKSREESGCVNIVRYADAEVVEVK